MNKLDFFGHDNKPFIVSPVYEAIMTSGIIFCTSSKNSAQMGKQPRHLPIPILTELKIL